MKLLPEIGAVATSVDDVAALHLDRAGCCLPLQDGWHGILSSSLSAESRVDCAVVDLTDTDIAGRYQTSATRYTTENTSPIASVALS